MKNQTNLFEHSDYQNILHLQKHRHLCAHPVLLQNYELYSPNKETVRAHIVNILQGLLIKPALLSKKIFKTFVENLSEIKDILIKEKDIEIHLKSKYFDNLNIAIEKDIFKALWKIVFKLDNTDCNENRDINYKALKIILNRNYEIILEFIEENNDYFSNNLDLKFFDIILSFLCDNPKIFTKLNDSSQTLITNTIENNENYIFIAWFINDNISNHLIEIYAIDANSLIRTKSILNLYFTCKSQGLLSEGRNLLTYMYSKSSDFNQADDRFEKLIEPFLDEFNLHELTKIVESVHNNGQINGRKKAIRTNRLIKESLDKFDSDFNYSQFDYFEF